MFCLCSPGWALDLLNAADIPSALSAGYVEDVRHLFLRRFERELQSVGLPVAQTCPQRLSRGLANIVDCSPFADPYGNMHGSDFCFGYGAGSFSFDALNYRSPFIDACRPIHFMNLEHPLVLGNFAVRLEKPASSMLVFPPPDLQVAGVAEVATAKHSCVLMWLGVRYAARAVDQWLIDDLEALGSLETMFSGSATGYAYGTVFSRQYAGARYDLDPDEERELRERMGFPPKGRPIREQILYESVCGIFGGNNVIRRYRGKELERLEIDIWVPSVRLAIEYQGQQHFKHVEHWHGVDGLEKQKKRDAKKRRLCKELGIRLLYFDAKDDLGKESVVFRLRKSRVI